MPERAVAPGMPKPSRRGVPGDRVGHCPAFRLLRFDEQAGGDLGQHRNLNVSGASRRSNSSAYPCIVPMYISAMPWVLIPSSSRTVHTRSFSCLLSEGERDEIAWQYPEA